MSTLYTFPGQGAQRSHLLHALEPHAEVERTLGEAADVLGFDPLELDAPGRLESTLSVQLCLLIAGVATARTLSSLGATPDMVAGLSIGAFAAAVTAGILRFDEAVRVVAERGELMQGAYPEGFGMAAIVGLPRRTVEEIVSVQHRESAPLYLSAENAERQFVVSGHDAALAGALRMARDAGARKSERLAVAVPSHCPLLDRAAVALAEVLRPVTLRRPDIAWMSSNRARVLIDPEAIREDLAWNMARPVRWSETMRLAYERGARLIVEMPPGSVLTRLWQEAQPQVLAIACESSRVTDIVARMRGAPTSDPATGPRSIRS